KAKVRELYDECKSLNDSYGGTTLGVKLTAIQTELKTFMESNTEPTWEQNIVALQREVQSMAKKGEIAQAAAKLNEFGEKFKEKDVLELFNKLKEQREFLKRESMAHVNREITKATKELAAEGAKKDEIK